MKAIYTLMLILAGTHTAAQEIAGLVFDKKDRPVPGSKLTLYKDDKPVGIGSADRHGNFCVNSVEPGIYSVVFSCPGYDSMRINQVLASPGYNRNLKVVLYKQKRIEESVITITCPRSLPENPDSYIFTRQDLANSAR